MKQILCYGDSNTWGNIAGTFDPKRIIHGRYEWGVRWTSILQELLGSDYHVIEAGLNGRTTDLDETHVHRPSRNGLATLPGIMDMHYPLDWVILMLGTNDLKIQFKSSAEWIVSRLRQLIETIRNSPFGRKDTAPKVLLMAPAPIFRPDGSTFDLFFDQDSIEKSHCLAMAYQKLSEELGCDFLDLGPLVTIDPKDGLHLDQKSQRVLALEIVKKIIGADQY